MKCNLLLLNIEGIKTEDTKLEETIAEENKVDKSNNKAKLEENIVGDIFLEKYNLEESSVDVLVVSHSEQKKVC